MPVLPGITITLDSRDLRSETIASAVAPYVVVLTTTLADLAVTVASSYVGHTGVPTHVTHLNLTPERRWVAQAQLAHDEVPVTHARERCLLEHATAVQDVSGAHVHLADGAMDAAAEL